MIFDDHDYRVMLHTSFAAIMIFIMTTHPCNVPPIREDHDLNHWIWGRQKKIHPCRVKRQRQQWSDTGWPQSEPAGRPSGGPI